MYATPADLDAAWGASLIDVLTIDPRSTVRDQVKIGAALANAGAVIDGYVSRRFPLPLDLAPAGAALLRKLACDLAAYDLATSADRMTEIIDKRQQQALAFLRDVAAARADIAVASAVGAAGGGTAAPGAISPGEPVIVAPQRQFTAASLRDY